MVYYVYVFNDPMLNYAIAFTVGAVILKIIFRIIG